MAAVEAPSEHDPLDAAEVRDPHAAHAEEASLFPPTPRGLLAAAMSTGAFAPTATSLVFLVFLVVPVWQDFPRPRAVLATALLLLFAVLYVLSVGIAFYSLRARLLWLGAMWAVVAALAALISTDVVYLVMFLVIMHAIVLPWRWGRAAVVVVGLAGFAGGIAIGEEFPIFLAVAGIIMALVIGASIERGHLEARLEKAERRSALLAVAAERERIGRDLHDILGHSLTTITVTAQLAHRLVEADPEAARAQLAEIERTSRQALADVRATASGLQQVRAASEIASARSVLLAAGIEADVPAALPALSDERAELFGYVIREGVTNVVRHARASRCTIRVTGSSASIADDGRGMASGAPRSGLAGLERRVAEAGGVLTAEAADGGGTVVTATLPEQVGTGGPVPTDRPDGGAR